MRWIIPVLIFVVAGCGGSLSDEQRKEMREARKSQSIQKLSEAEITEQAYSTGRLIAGIVEKNPRLTDSLSTTYHAVIRWLDPAAATASEIEKQVFEAYLNSAITGSPVSDNVQRIGTDSLLYTKPVTTELPDGSVQVKGTWSVKLSRKEVVLGMSKK